jgi:hypothetical protein
MSDSKLDKAVMILSTVPGATDVAGISLEIVLVVGFFVPLNFKLNKTPNSNN